MFYIPCSGKFQKLPGKGMSLGVDKNAQINEYEINGWVKNSLLIITSDRLKESRNFKGEMNREKRLVQVLKENRIQSAKIIEKNIRRSQSFSKNILVADVDTVGLDSDMIRKYVKHQERKDKRSEQPNLFS